MIRGECNCGAVSFAVDTSVADVYVCHCSICRRSTGSSGIAVSIVSSAQFRWTQGQEHIRTWHKPGHDWETSFCMTCGSPLPGKNDDSNKYIPVSLLSEGAHDLRVAHHIFVGSKADWEEIGDSGKQHPGAYGE